MPSGCDDVYRALRGWFGDLDLDGDDVEGRGGIFLRFLDHRSEVGCFFLDSLLGWSVL